MITSSLEGGKEKLLVVSLLLENQNSTLTSAQYGEIEFIMKWIKDLGSF